MTDVSRKYPGAAFFTRFVKKLLASPREKRGRFVVRGIKRPSAVELAILDEIQPHFEELSRVETADALPGEDAMAAAEINRRLSASLETERQKGG